ncbi:MAG: family 10 glycosylhydrolase [Pirellulales bacterium]
MPRLLLVLASLLLATACSLRVPAQGAEPPPPVAREFRGAWIATVDNIDYPSQPGLPAAQLRAEFDALVARAVELKLNALVFQVRPAADAFYKSSLEPWSEWLTGTQGKAPDGGFDPLAYAIERCHANGLQLHAWFNPFRAWHEAGKSVPHASHVTQKAPRLCVPYGKFSWMDPGEPLAVKWSLATVQDVVQRYDVDGVHLDDYFYPYPQGKLTFADDGSYGRYRADGGTLPRSAWRRQNVDDYVRRLYALVHEAKPWVAVGISPFGIARPGLPKGISAGIDQYEQLGADPVRWLRDGVVDYLSPQLYWPIDEREHAFDVLLAWWNAQNPLGRGLWPGISAVRALAGQKNFRATELADEIALIRGGSRAPGYLLYSFKALRPDAPNVGGALRDRIQREAAAVPAMAWLSAATPRAPTLRIDAVGAERSVRWETDAEARFVVVQAQTGERWRTCAIVGAERRQAPLPAGTRAVAVTALGKSGAASAAATAAVPK